MMLSAYVNVCIIGSGILFMMLYSPYFFFFFQLFLLLSQSFVFSFIKPRSSCFFSALANFLKQIQLIQFLNQFLILLLLVKYFLFFKLWLSLLFFDFPLISIIFLNLFDKQPAFDASTAAILPRSILNQEFTKDEILLLCAL